MHCGQDLTVFVVTYRVTNFLPKLIDMLLFSRKNWISIFIIPLFSGIARKKRNYSQTDDPHMSQHSSTYGQWVGSWEQGITGNGDHELISHFNNAVCCGSRPAFRTETRDLRPFPFCSVKIVPEQAQIQDSDQSAESKNCTSDPHGPFTPSVSGILGISDTNAECAQHVVFAHGQNWHLYAGLTSRQCKNRNLLEFLDVDAWCESAFNVLVVTKQSSSTPRIQEFGQWANTRQNNLSPPNRFAYLSPLSVVSTTINSKGPSPDTTSMARCGSRNLVRVRANNANATWVWNNSERFNDCVWFCSEKKFSGEEGSVEFAGEREASW